MSEEPYIYELNFKVRDYECDLQGVVNNGTYMNYLEHARHEFLVALGLDFAEMHENGIDAMVIKAELEYKFPLKSGDDFSVKLRCERDGRLKFVFIQDVYLKEGDKLVLKGKITAATIKNRRPIEPMDIVDALEAYKQKL